MDSSTITGSIVAYNRIREIEAHLKKTIPEVKLKLPSIQKSLEMDQFDVQTLQSKMFAEDKLSLEEASLIHITAKDWDKANDYLKLAIMLIFKQLA